MIREKIIDLVEQSLELNKEDIDFDADLVNELDIDSIDLLDFIMQVEDEFDVEFEEDELDNIKTLNQMIEVLESKEN
ncbi:MAG: phosphopantetheine-binding protein [Tissierellia bacterium]|nr:phosphopantetheine-binding protein [Tissierellia bacterium]